MTERTILNQVGFISRVYLRKLFLSIGRNTFSRGLLIARVNKFARALVRARVIARVKRKGLMYHFSHEEDWVCNCLLQNESQGAGLIATTVDRVLLSLSSQGHILGILDIL